MKILIVEDDYWQANEMKGWLTDEGYTVIGVVKSGEEALEIVEKDLPDLMIVDIELKGKINNGIELMTTIQKKHNLAFFYLTSDSISSYYEQARATNPQAYLTKAEVNTQKSLLRKVDLALHQFANTHKPLAAQIKVDDAIFALDNNEMYVKIPFDNIGWLEAMGSYTKIVTSEKRQFTVSRNLSTLMSKIDFPRLIRINQSYAVNLNNVTGFKGKHQVQVCHTLLPKSVSDKYCPDFMKYFSKT